MKTNDEIRRDNLLLAIARVGTATALAEKAKVSSAYLSQVKNRSPESKTGVPKNMGDDVARKIEEAIGEPKGWMDTDHSEIGTGVALLPEGKGNVIVWDKAEDLEPDADRVWIDRYDYHFSAGTGLIQWEVREKKALPFDAGFFKALQSKPKDCRLLSVRGDSMEPYLFNRDMMMIDVTRTAVRDGRVYAIYFEEEPLVKQAFKQVGGGLILHSYNTKYPDKLVDANHLELVKIVGEVIHRSGSGLAGGN